MRSLARTPSSSRSGRDERGVTFEQAQQSDVEGIQHVAAESWRATYKGIFSPEFITDFLARAYSMEGLSRSVRNPEHIFLVARDGPQVVGFCHYGVGRQGPELFRMYVLPGYWRTGTGTGFLRLLESGLAGQGVAAYYCYVHSRNEIGKAFYLQRGFVHEPTRDRDHEWCMIRRLRD